ncbi:MAG: ATP-binding cassette domain-containing protein [Candidatus Nanosalina sp.]
MTSIKIKELSKSYKNKKVFENFDLEVEDNEVLGIKGPSGIGKTTLMRCIAGLETYSGEIRVKGDISYLFQDDRILNWLNARKNILIPFRLKGKSISDHRMSRIRDLARKLGVKSILDSPVSEISGGQKQRILVTRALATDPDILLLDEPFRSLDPENRGKIRKEAIEMARENGTTTLISSHRKDIRNITDRVIDFEERKGVKRN